VETQVSQTAVPTWVAAASLFMACVLAVLASLAGQVPHPHDSAGQGSQTGRLVMAIGMPDSVGAAAVSVAGRDARAMSPVVLAFLDAKAGFSDRSFAERRRRSL
jgi:hypothetical protein